MTEVEQPSQNGITTMTEEDDSNKARPADIEADMREMERRKRVEAIMSSRLFREELERIVDSQIREGGASGILQQLSDIVGVPASRVGSVFKSSNCVLPINDIRGVESMGYSKGEKILRCKLAATFRLLDLYGWTQGLGAQVTARLNADQELFLVNPFGLLFHEVTASSLNKVDMQGNVVEQGTTNFGINTNHYILHSVVHAARPDLRCAIYIGCNPVVAVSSLKVGLLPLTKDSAVLGEISTHPYTGSLNEPEEREKLIRSLGPVSKVLLLNNHGALCCGETIEEAFYAAYHIVQACETQLKLLPVGLDNLVLIPEEARKAIYDASRKPPDGYEHKTSSDNQQQQQDNKERPLHQKPKWRVGGADFEALMRMLDNAGFRTGYIYRHPLVKSELPKPKNDVECPPAVSSLGYLLEEEELYRQGVWKKSDLRKGGDRTRWLNSPNVYQKVEVLETGTPDPKKITKWVADGSPTHSTPVKIENALQFVPQGTNPKEFKRLQQQIKDNRRADKISAGPQSHILEGVTWDEANRIKDATVSATGDHVVLMGAASKGIIQRGYQHNATVYKAPYAKNPFDSVTDDELNEYKRTIERKHGHGEYTDTDFSESEALSSLQTSGAQQKSPVKTAPSQSETEETSEPQVLRIETKQAPKPSQPEVVLSDATNDFLNVERMHSTTTKKPPTGRAIDNSNDIKTISQIDKISDASNQAVADSTSDLLRTKITKEFSPQTITSFNAPIVHEYPVKMGTSSKNALKELSLYKSPNYSAYNFVKLDDFDDSDDGFNSEASVNIFEKFRNPHIDLPYVSYNGDEMRVYDSIENDSPVTYLQVSDYYTYETISGGNLESPKFFLYDTAHYSSNYSPGNISRKFYIPYRTSSHFGFNSPSYSKPDHKHIPIIPSKYIPLQRGKSLDEFFSSKQYADASMDTFNKVLKRKAYDSLVRSNKIAVDCCYIKEKRLKLSLPSEDVYEDIDVHSYCAPSSSESVETKKRTDFRLDPIMEDEEWEMTENNADGKINESMLKSAFNERISKMNYSNVSPNPEFVPTMTVTSDFSITPVASFQENVSEYADDVDDLGKQLNDLTLEEKLNNHDSPRTNRIEPESRDFLEDLGKQLNELALQESVGLDDSPTRKLMTRTERDDRKKEFFELWEDHISFHGPDDETEDSFYQTIVSARSFKDQEVIENKKFVEEQEEIYKSVNTSPLCTEKSSFGNESKYVVDELLYKDVLPVISGDESFLIDHQRETSNPRKKLKRTNSNKNETDNFDDENELNSIEKLILSKISNNTDEDPIFKKIETTIRSKLTPSKLEILERKISDETLKQIASSTPSTDNCSSGGNSFFSLNVSNVSGSPQNLPRPPITSNTSYSSSEGQENRKPRPKPPRKNVSKVHLSRSRHQLKSPSAPAKNTTPQENKNEVHVDVKITSSLTSKTDKKKRNFIAENIMNVSMRKNDKRHNMGAIFSINPFRSQSPEGDVKVQVKHNLPDSEKVESSIYSFQTGTSATGSPRLWVSVSPRCKPTSYTGATKKVPPKKKKPLACTFQDTAGSSSSTPCKTGVTNELKNLGKATKKLKKCVENCEKGVTQYKKQIKQISKNFDEIVELQEDIESSRSELRQEILNSQRNQKFQYDMISFSISEHED